MRCRWWTAPLGLRRASASGPRSSCAVQATQRTLRIVGYDEIDPARHWISIDAPVARALLGKHPGDTLALPGPAGPERWTVEAFTYDEP